MSDRRRLDGLTELLRLGLVAFAAFAWGYRRGRTDETVAAFQQLHADTFG